PDAAVRNINVTGLYVDVPKKMLLHEMAEALRMRRRESQVFVEIEGYNLREIDGASFVEANKIFVNADHGPAGGEAERQPGFSVDRAGDELRGLLIDFSAIAL